jgi:hypothetical protein
MMVLKIESLLMSKSLLGELNLLVNNKPIVPIDQGIEHLAESL